VYPSSILFPSVSKSEAKAFAILARIEVWAGLVAFAQFTGRLQDVFDYPVHWLSVILNCLPQTQIRAVQFLGLAQYLRGMTNGRRRSAITWAGALLKVSLAAIPLLLKFQCAVTGQVHAAMGAADHRRRFQLGRGLGGGSLALVLAPEPHGSGNHGDPE
jgi:hypothetical protein